MVHVATNELRTVPSLAACLAGPVFGKGISKNDMTTGCPGFQHSAYQI